LQCSRCLGEEQGSRIIDDASVACPQLPINRGTIIFTLSISPFVCDCPECNSEISVDLGATHRPFSDNEKMVYRVVCGTCGLSYDVHFEDLRPGDEPE
jgi:hypothetical protein